jgi:hypothetical protein
LNVNIAPDPKADATSNIEITPVSYLHSFGQKELAPTMEVTEMADNRPSSIVDGNRKCFLRHQIHLAAG